MDETDRTAISKFLSLILRHRPEVVGVTLDDRGWVNIDVLLRSCAKQGRSITRRQLDEVVTSSPKQRFAISEDGLSIRANQGHSTKVDLGHAPTSPPDVLFHGTTRHALPAIAEHGLLRMSRHHVHLSSDLNTARGVGKRRGKAVVLRVDARAMARAGYVFLLTPNSVWLTDAVPSAFISGFE